MFLFWKSRKAWRWLAALALVFVLHFFGLTRAVENYLFLAIKPMGVYLQRLGSWPRSGVESDLDALALSEKLARSRDDLARALVDQSKKYS